MKVYVAGAEPPRVKAAMMLIRQSGHQVCDWFSVYQPAQEMSREERRRAAQWCINEIVSSDVIWLLAPQGRPDSLVELGVAIGMARIPTVVSGTLVHRGIFGALAEAEFDEDEEALAWILALGTPRV